jgi:peptidoglycan/xylan/chitin deacetylase (PgdA/CDA1 family)
VKAKTTLLYILKILGVFSLARLLCRRRVRVLCYHGVWSARDGYAGDAMFIRPDTFAGRLQFLYDHGFNVISLEQAVAGLRDRRLLPPHPVVITIDDGWYSTFAGMLPALKRRRMPATIYCDTDNLLAGLPIPHVMARYLWRIHGSKASLSPEAEQQLRRATDLTVDRQERYAAAIQLAESLGVDVDGYIADRVFCYMTPEELAQAHRDGFAVELHTHRHSLHGFEAERIAEEIALNRNALAALLGKPANSFKHFCYPSGEVAPGVERVLGSLDIATATTLETGLASRRANLRLLPRLTDGEHLSPIEFEAEMCGIGDLLRTLRRWAMIYPHAPAKPTHA